MSSALAIAATTFLIKDLLDNHLIAQGLTSSLGEVSVTALPPDRVPVGAEERSQLNLFLYRITPYTGWRGSRVGDGAPNGRVAPAAPPLTLDLHYLLAAYGEHDFHAELLLGVAMRVLHQTPALTAAAIRGVLTTGVSAGGSSPLRAALAAASINAGGEGVTIEPEFLSSEETSKLWSALQARYRPSAAYKVSAVVLDGGE